MQSYNRSRIIDMLDETELRIFCKALDAYQASDYETSSDLMNELEQRFVGVHGFDMHAAYTMRNLVWKTICDLGKGFR